MNDLLPGILWHLPHPIPPMDPWHLKNSFLKGWSKIVKYCSSERAWSSKGIIQNFMRLFPKHLWHYLSWGRNQKDLGTFSWVPNLKFLLTEHFAGKHGNLCQSRQRARSICLSNKLKLFLSIAKFRRSKAFFRSILYYIKRSDMYSRF